VLEASTHSRWVSSIVKKLGHEVTVAVSLTALFRDQPAVADLTA
jgi:hypothetical protein